MNLAIFYDTETTGLPLFREPSEDLRQPHLVQLAAHQVDMDTREILQSMDVIIKPESNGVGWVIPQEVSEIHGITTEHAMAVGIGEDLAMRMFIDLWARRPRIAHNESFDARIIRIATKRYFGTDIINWWRSGTAECTCNLATPIVKCPPSEKMKAKNMKGYKKANLTEAYNHFFNEDFDGAHTAIADVKACMSVYFAIKDNE